MGEVAKVKRISSESLAKLIPVPPQEEQERIVAMLDRFDALVNDLFDWSAGGDRRPPPVRVLPGPALTFEESAV